MNSDPAPSEPGVPARHSLGRTTVGDSDPGQDGGPGAWFPVVLRGYERSQVDTRLTELDRQLRDETVRADTAEADLAAVRAQLQRLQDGVDAATRDGDVDRFGLRLERVLQAAERESVDLREKAVTEATALVDDARAEATSLIDNARAEAELQRQRTEEALLGRAAKLDREFTSRSAALDAREKEIGQHVTRARQEAESIRSEAQRAAVTERSDAERTSAELRRDSRDDVERERAGAAQELDRLAAMREDIRGELARLYGMLRGELDRDPDASGYDGGTLFGDLGDVHGPNDVRGHDQTPDQSAPGTLRLAPEPRDAADDRSDADGGDGADAGDADAGDANAHTTVGTIPANPVASIGVLPFGDRNGERPTNGRAFAFELALPRTDGPDHDGDAPDSGPTSDDVTGQTAAPGPIQTRSTLPTRGRR